MNFPAFTGPIPSIHQFAAKFGYEGGSGGLVQGQDVAARYSPNVSQFGTQSHLPTMDIGGKFRSTENAVSLNNVPNSVGVSLGGLTAMQTLNTGTSKYQTLSTSASTITLNNLQQYTGAISTQYQQAGSGLGILQGQVSHGQTQQGEVTQQGQGTQHSQLVLQGQQVLKEERRSEGKAREINGFTQQIRDELSQEMMTIVHQQQGQTQNFNNQQQHTQIMVVLHDPKDVQTSLGKTIKQEIRDNRINGTAEFINPSVSASSMSMAATWQSLAAPGSAVADYLSQLPASALPLSLHHLLKYSATDNKRVDDVTTNNLISAAVAANGLNTVIPGNGVGSVVVQSAALNSINSLNTSTIVNSPAAVSPAKKKKKKKAPKEKKPRPKPGEIRLTTALDGSTLYCCPECQMAYPERGMLEQHLVGHTMERRFICDICNAALKRKDHLTRHKQSHNPERPYVCTVCLKAFKRKEQLTLHFVIHSGEKRHVCQECGKGFYRKDHLRKHTRSHIARRVKAELSQQGGVANSSATPQGPLASPVPAPS